MGVVCAATFRASIVPSTQARESMVPAALEDAMSGGIKKKERLSREERTALVESFVLRCEIQPVSSHVIVELCPNLLVEVGSYRRLTASPIQLKLFAIWTIYIVR